MHYRPGVIKSRNIVEGALRVFEREGFSRAKVEDIAHEAGVARTSFYFYFPTKDDVVASLMNEGEQAVLTGLREAHPTTLEGFLEVLRAQLAAFWGVPARRCVLPEIFRLRIQRAAGFLTPTDDELLSLLTSHFTQAAARGEVTTSVPAPQLAGHYLMGCFAALAAKSPMPVEYGLTQAHQLFMRGAHGPISLSAS